WVKDNVLMTEDGRSSSPREPVETFDTSVEEMMRTALAEALREIGKQPEKLSKEERLGVIEALDQVGVFLIKNSFAFVGEALGVSRATLYNHVNQVRGISAHRKQGKSPSPRAKLAQDNQEQEHAATRRTDSRQGCPGG
ncbi:MAG: helix-turn-helix domain-containing protein, partial [Candidatus Bipolaricaulia bacterium]